MIIKLLKYIPLLILLVACKSQVSDEILISDAWVRASAPGQAVGAAYMTLTSPVKSTLVYTEAINDAGAVEIHSMNMDNGIMKMRILDELSLEPNKPVSLKPGSFHLMLFDLKEPFKEGQQVDFRLCFMGDDGEITEKNITVPVKIAQ